jgi:hypothetical protein
LDQHLVTWIREVADQRIHETTQERPVERFLQAEQAALTPIENHPSYLRQRRLLRKVPTDARVDVDTNHDSVPLSFIGETGEAVTEADRLQVQWRDRIIAEHSVDPGRHQVVEDPAHVAPLATGAWKLAPSLGIQRDLAEYGKVVGGEA